MEEKGYKDTLIVYLMPIFLVGCTSLKSMIIICLKCSELINFLFLGRKKRVCYLLLWRKGEEQDIKNLRCIWSKSVSIHWWHWQTVWDDNRGMPQISLFGFSYVCLQWMDFNITIWLLQFANYQTFKTVLGYIYPPQKGVPPYISVTPLLWLSPFYNI